jgi:hypothetical protein
VIIHLVLPLRRRILLPASLWRNCLSIGARIKSLADLQWPVDSSYVKLALALIERLKPNFGKGSTCKKWLTKSSIIFVTMR